MARGVAKFFTAEKGWGAIASDELPAGTDAFVHFSHIEASANTYRTLAAGDGDRVAIVPQGTPDTPLLPQTTHRPGAKPDAADPHPVANSDS